LPHKDSSSKFLVRAGALVPSSASPAHTRLQCRGREGKQASCITVVLGSDRIPSGRRFLAF
jgi:RES domain-containing protein